jgi:hypothetical protein
VVGRGSIVLMARIVDSTGVAIRSSDVVAIEYSVFEVDAFWPEQRQVMRGHRAVPLVVRDVLFESGRRTDVQFKLRCSALQNPLPVRYASDYRTATNAARRCPATLSRPCSFGPSPQGGGSMSAHPASGVNHD